ncbi:MAG: hypothetical protein OEY14_08330 [Myxococcales bacterium]|nr:hypothetical protein [Myxococcales bacterium]
MGRHVESPARGSIAADGPLVPLAPLAPLMAPLGLLLAAALLMSPETASAQPPAGAPGGQRAEPPSEESSGGVFGGVSAGALILGAHLGFRDAIASDWDLRLEAGIEGAYAPAHRDGVAVRGIGHALFHGADPVLRAYGGIGLRFGWVQEFRICIFGPCDESYESFIIGPDLVAGLELGSSWIRLLVELGAGVSLPFTDLDVPILLHPRVALGLSIGAR